MSYLWGGRFSSDASGSCFGLPMVQGKIATTLPIEIQNTNNSSAVLEYDGFYRRGQKTQMQISYAPSPDLSTIGGQGSQVGVCGSFKGGSTLTQQQIDFVINHMTETTIEGTYVSKNPGDKGEFHITRLLQIQG